MPFLRGASSGLHCAMNGSSVRAPVGEQMGRFYHLIFQQYEILVVRFFCFKELTLETPLWLVSNLTHR